MLAHGDQHRRDERPRAGRVPDGGRGLSGERPSGRLAHHLAHLEPQPLARLDPQRHAGPRGIGPARGAAHLGRADPDRMRACGCSSTGSCRSPSRGAEDRAAIEAQLDRGGPIEEAIANATAALSGLSACAGIVLVPKEEPALRQLAFVPLVGAPGGGGGGRQRRQRRESGDRPAAGRDRLDAGRGRQLCQRPPLRPDPLARRRRGSGARYATARRRSTRRRARWSSAASRSGPRTARAGR